MWRPQATVALAEPPLSWSATIAHFCFHAARSPHLALVPTPSAADPCAQPDRMRMHEIGSTCARKTWSERGAPHLFRARGGGRRRGGSIPGRPARNSGLAASGAPVELFIVGKKETKKNSLSMRGTCSVGTSSLWHVGGVPCADLQSTTVQPSAQHSAHHSCRHHVTLHHHLVCSTCSETR